LQLYNIRRGGCDVSSASKVHAFGVMKGGKGIVLGNSGLQVTLHKTLTCNASLSLFLWTHQSSFVLK